MMMCLEFYLAQFCNNHFKVFSYSFFRHQQGQVSIFQLISNIYYKNKFQERESNWNLFEKSVHTLSRICAADNSIVDQKCWKYSIVCCINLYKLFFFTEVDFCFHTNLSSMRVYFLALAGNVTLVFETVLKPVHDFLDWTVIFTAWLNVSWSNIISNQSVRSNFCQSLSEGRALFRTLNMSPN